MECSTLTDLNKSDMLRQLAFLFKEGNHPWKLEKPNKRLTDKLTSVKRALQEGLREAQFQSGTINSKQQVVHTWHSHTSTGM